MVYVNGGWTVIFDVFIACFATPRVWARNIPARGAFFSTVASLFCCDYSFNIPTGDRMNKAVDEVRL
jgi:hypothetical protein